MYNSILGRALMYEFEWHHTFPTGINKVLLSVFKDLHTNTKKNRWSSMGSYLQCRVKSLAWPHISLHPPQCFKICATSCASLSPSNTWGWHTNRHDNNTYFKKKKKRHFKLVIALLNSAGKPVWCASRLALNGVWCIFTAKLFCFTDLILLEASIS